MFEIIIYFSAGIGVGYIVDQIIENVIGAFFGNGE